jgi:hypothetical protein
MPNASAYNPDPIRSKRKEKKERQKVENCNRSNTREEQKNRKNRDATQRSATQRRGVRVPRTCNDAKYVSHTGVPPKHAAERRPTRDGRYRQGLKNAQ